MGNIDIKIEDGKLILTAPIDGTPSPSSSGKTLLLASSGGFYRPDGLFHDGKQVAINFVACIKA